MSGVELSLTCHTCAQEGTRQPRLSSRRALANHLNDHGKITPPKKENAK